MSAPSPLALAPDDTRWSALAPNSRLLSAEEQACLHTTGAVMGLALGMVVSVTTDVPLAPEAGLLLGALVGWFSRREGA